MSKQQPERTDNGRRQFIKALGAAGGAAAVATVASQAQAEVVEQPEVEVKSAQGYQKTDHVRAYYDSARV